MTCIGGHREKQSFPIHTVNDRNALQIGRPTARPSIAEEAVNMRCRETHCRAAQRWGFWRLYIIGDWR
jgi:hypothetical protein